MIWLTLLIFAATLGAGGYFVYKMVEMRLRGIDDTILAHQTSVEDVKDVLKGYTERPVGARIDRRKDDLIPVHQLRLCTKTQSIAARTVGSLSMGPSRSNYFRVTAMRMMVHADGFPSIEQRVQLQAVEINTVPMFDFSSTSYRDVVRAAWSDMFSTPVGFAVRVELDVISSEALIHPLFLEFRNDNPNEVRVTVELYGENLDFKPVQKSQEQEGT